MKLTDISPLLQSGVLQAQYVEENEQLRCEIALLLQLCGEHLGPSPTRSGTDGGTEGRHPGALGRKEREDVSFGQRLVHDSHQFVRLDDGLHEMFDQIRHQAVQRSGTVAQLLVDPVLK